MRKKKPRRKTVLTVGDLPKKPNGVFLYCPTCRREWSACRSDYFMLPASHKMLCDCLSDESELRYTPLVLAKKLVTIVQVSEP